MYKWQNTSNLSIGTSLAPSHIQDRHASPVQLQSHQPLCFPCVHTTLKMLPILLFSTLFSFTTSTKPTHHPEPAAISTQYDAIATQYSGMKDFPAGSLKYPSVDAIIGNITGLRCLDLASGLGRWSKYLLEKGAASVVGIDISTQMVENATLDSQNLARRDP